MLGKPLPATALCVAILVGSAANAAATTDATPASEPPATPSDQIVVTARAIGELRLRIRLAEDAVYARFNEINSDDRFDIHCYQRAVTGTRIERRLCLSNSWRQEDANIGKAALAAMRGEYSANPVQYRAKQLYVEQLVADEFRRLSSEDAELHEAMVRLGQAQQALDVLTGGHASRTLEREVRAGDERLPSGTRHMFDVRIGLAPWTYKLTERTFTLGSVSGEIQNVRIDCDHGGANIEFRDEVEWTLPDAWGKCRLKVGAKRDTTFAFVEFE